MMPDIARILGKLRMAALRDESGAQLDELLSMHGKEEYR